MRLTEYINGQAFPFLMLAFTSVSAVEEYLKEQSLALLIMPVGEEKAKWDIPVLFLSDIRTEDEKLLFRYQSAARLSERISYCFFRAVPQKNVEDAAVYMVYSPFGRCGKTALSMELIRQLPGSLYIGMEEFNSLPGDGQGVEQLLYSIMQKHEGVIEELVQYRQNVFSAYALASPDCYFDFRVLDREHLEWFCAQLTQSGQYTAVVFDVGSGVFESPELLLGCDRLLVPMPAGQKGGKKQRSMEAGFTRLGFQKLLERMEYLELPEADRDRTLFQRKVSELLSGNINI